jgi:hypothetical protein
MENIPIRRIGKRTNVLSARWIDRLGFGSTDITSKNSQELITAIDCRAFRLCCQCIIEAYEDAGGVCLACRQEIETMLANMPAGIGDILTVSELNWLSTPCREHFLRCSISTCREGRCVRHIATGPDGRPYCQPHYVALIGELDFKALQDVHGPLRAHALRFFKTLLVDDPQ